MADEQKQPMNDHDLLIRLDTRFEDFTKNHSAMWGTFTELVHKFMTAIDSKADRHELLRLEENHNSLRKVVEAHETARKVDDGKKQVIFHIGDLGFKFWGALLGAATLIIALAKALK